MKTDNVNFKIFLPQSSIQLRLNLKKAAELAEALRSKTIWIDLPVSKGHTLHVKSENIMGYEFTTLGSGNGVQDGLMRINALAEKFGVHPVSLSRLISKGKIPAVSSEGKKRKHSQANIDTALALRDWMLKQNKDTLSEIEIKKMFSEG